jgi:serine/threonine protein phosphatase 1
VPDGVVVYAVGDIHGCSHLLDRLHAAVADDASKRSGSKHIVYLGDYVDRGPDSKGVIERLQRNVPPGIVPKFLKGNHDAVLKRFLDEPQVYHDWSVYGAQQTLLSYGVKPPLFHSIDRYEAARLALIGSMPQSHVDFLEQLDLTWTLGDYVFVHAGIRPNVPLDKQREQDLLWIRDDFLMSDVNVGKVVVHGHTPVRTPCSCDRRISVDTGAYISGVLTCVVLEGENRAFIQACL